MLLVFGCYDYGNGYFYRMWIWISYGNRCYYLRCSAVSVTWTSSIPIIKVEQGSDKSLSHGTNQRLTWNHPECRYEIQLLGDTVHLIHWFYVSLHCWKMGMPLNQKSKIKNFIYKSCRAQCNQQHVSFKSKFMYRL
jgi:hypothetical protein